MVSAALLWCPLVLRCPCTVLAWLPDLDTFESGPGSADAWQASNGVQPLLSRPAYCGRYGLALTDPNLGGSWGVNFRPPSVPGWRGETTGGGGSLEAGQTARGYSLVHYPFVCMAYRIPATTIANLAVYVTGGVGWRSVNITPPRSPLVGKETSPAIATWSLSA